MIYFLANYNPMLYPIEHCKTFQWQTWRNKFAQFYNFPERDVPDNLLVSYTDAIVKNHNDPKWRAYYGNIGITSNSMVLHTAFRVAIKEGRLKPEDFETTYVHEDGRVWTIAVDKDGDCSCYPEGFFDTFENLLTRLL